MSTVDYSEDLGDPIRGPSALSGDPRRFWHLTYTVARTEFKLRFYGSVLGYLWTLMRPLLLFGVLDVVYSLGKLGGYDSRYPAMLLSGVVMYTFFLEATGGAVSCVVDRENFVRKIQFPRLAIPLAVVLTAIFNLCANCLAIAVFIFIDGVRPRIEWIELPFIFVALAVFAAGCAMLLSALYVRFRDIRPIWDVICQVLFYISLILIPIERIYSKSTTLLHLWMLNPLADLMQQFRAALLGPVQPPHPGLPPDPSGSFSAAEAIGGYAHLMIPIGICVFITVFGFWIFNRSAPHIADNL
ncbi:MAG: ABC transporter permease [Solirubrobacteraceae bacterium]|jgi:ABC-2 type transport system permease protein